MKQDTITAIAMFCVGAFGGAVLMATVLSDRTIELSQRELIITDSPTTPTDPADTQCSK